MNISRALARVCIASVSAFIIIAIAVPAQAQRISIKDLLARIVALETENTQLRARVEELEQLEQMEAVLVDANDVVVGKALKDDIILVDIDGQSVPFLILNTHEQLTLFLIGMTGVVYFADSTCTGQPFINLRDSRRVLGFRTPTSFLDISGNGEVYVTEIDAEEEFIVPMSIKLSLESGCSPLPNGALQNGSFFVPAISTGFILRDEFTPPFRVR